MHVDCLLKHLISHLCPVRRKWNEILAFSRLGGIFISFFFFMHFHFRYNLILRIKQSFVFILCFYFFNVFRFLAFFFVYTCFF